MAPEGCANHTTNQPLVFAATVTLAEIELACEPRLVTGVTCTLEKNLCVCRVSNIPISLAVDPVDFSSMMLVSAPSVEMAHGLADLGRFAVYGFLVGQCLSD